MKTAITIVAWISMSLFAFWSGYRQMDREWRSAMKIGPDVTIETAATYYLVPPPPLDDDAFAKRDGWVPLVTGEVVEHPDAASERAVNPNGTCGRCQRPWKTGDRPGVRSHSTPTSLSGGCHPLCVTCWRELTPEQRLPYYRDLWHEWNEYVSNDMPWEVMQAACLYENGKGWELEEDLPSEVIQAWKTAGLSPERNRDIEISIPVSTPKDPVVPEISEGTLVETLATPDIEVKSQPVKEDSQYPFSVGAKP